MNIPNQMAKDEKRCNFLISFLREKIEDGQGWVKQEGFDPLQYYLIKDLDTSNLSTNKTAPTP